VAADNAFRRDGTFGPIGSIWFQDTVITAGPQTEGKEVSPPDLARNYPQQGSAIGKQWPVSRTSRVTNS
jgi:hypothetical protein